jgi:tetratricopeptide (TPR) repeat protein
MHEDRYGLPISTGSEVAAVAYRDGLDRILSAWTGAGEALDRALVDDPDFALAYIARARVHQIYGEAVEARAKAAHARRLAGRTTKRERQHVEIIASAIEGQPKAALVAAEEHLDEFPRDALVFSLLLGAFGLYAFSGRADHDAARVAICERHARHYGEDWWFLTYLGWSHTEAGNHGAGRTITELALSLRRENGNAAHALAHALYEQGDTAAGSTFLADWLPTYDRASFLNGHLSWHFALLALGSDDVDKALEIYQERIRPAVSEMPPLPPLNVFTDSASLLWRLSLAGRAGIEPHWRDVAAYSDRMFPRAGIHFADVHWALVAVATQREDFDQRLAELETLQASGKLAPGQLVIDLCRGICAFAKGDYDAAILAFEPLMPAIAKIGGSHAQRELYEDTYMVACLRGGHPDKARQIISRRLDHRPSTSEPWLRRAHATPN